MAFENYTIEQFMAAKFKKNYSELSEEECETVYTEFIDVAELYDVDEFNKAAYRNYLISRINTIGIAIRLQREFIQSFGVPFKENFTLFKKFGHILKWTGNVEEFEKKLKRVENGEKHFLSELENCIKQLNEERDKKGDKQPAELTRQGFINTFISLGRLGFKIEKRYTTIEEMAYMIKKQKEENKK